MLHRWYFLVVAFTGSAYTCNTNNDWDNTNPREDFEWNSDVRSLQIETVSTSITNGERLILYLLAEGESVTEETTDMNKKSNRERLRFIDIKFSEPMEYQVGHCFKNLNTWKEFGQQPPRNAEKWTIVKSDAQLLIQCGNTRVLTMDFDKADTKDCKEKWARGVKKIHFSADNTASRCYKTVETCIFESINGDTSVPNPKLMPETHLPIHSNTVVSLYCDHDWFILTGDKTVTCLNRGIINPTAQTKCTRDLKMTCKSVFVKKGRSGTLEAELSKITAWRQEIWETSYGGHGQFKKGTGSEGRVLRHRITTLGTPGVYTYTAIIQKQGSNVACNGTLLVYSGKHRKSIANN